MAKKAKNIPVEGAKLVAFAPFSLDGQDYAEGDEFRVYPGIARDPQHDEFRQVEKKRGEVLGLTFTRTIERGKLEPITLRFILPLKEA